MTRTIRTTVIATALALASGCYYLAGPVEGAIYVRIAPPMPYHEVVAVAPGPRYAWRPGHWRWTAREFVWVPGVWIAIEPGYREWIPGRWAHDRHGWYWIDGHWR